MDASPHFFSGNYEYIAFWFNANSHVIKIFKIMPFLLTLYGTWDSSDVSNVNVGPNSIQSKECLPSVQKPRQKTFFT